MGRHCKTRRPVHNEFPADFPGRLELFREASGLSWRELARRLGVSTQRVRRWRAGTVPGSTHLFFLMQFADDLGLGDILRRPVTETRPTLAERDIGAARPCLV